MFEQWRLLHEKAASDATKLRMDRTWSDSQVRGRVKSHLYLRLHLCRLHLRGGLRDKIRIKLFVVVLESLSMLPATDVLLPSRGRVVCQILQRKDIDPGEVDESLRCAKD